MSRLAPSASLGAFAVRVARHARLFAFEDRGVAAVVAALVFPVVLGGAALGAETGFWYMKQRKLQHAADVAALAGGVRLRAGDAKAQIDAAAANVASKTGHSPSLGGMVVNIPPTGGVRSGDAASVEVVLTENHPRLLSSIFSSAPVAIRARAVANIVAGSKACILALSPTAAGAVTISGSAAVVLNGCDVASNSNSTSSFLLSGASATIATPCVSTVGEAVTTAGLSLTGCPTVKQYAPVSRDPYASTAAPVATGSCRNRNVGNMNNPTTLTPADSHPSGVMSMRFCDGLRLKGSVIFQPGLYIVEGGDLTINDGNLDDATLASLQGSGVTFYFANGGRLKLGGSAQLNVSAPTSGPFSGLLFFGDRTTAGATQKITGSSASIMQGAIYMPGSDIEYRGNSASGGCTQLIGRTIDISGNSTIGANCVAAGGKDIHVNEPVVLVE